MTSPDSTICINCEGPLDHSLNLAEWDEWYEGEKIQGRAGPFCSYECSKEWLQKQGKIVLECQDCKTVQAEYIDENMEHLHAGSYSIQIGSGKIQLIGCAIHVQEAIKYIQKGRPWHKPSYG
jgi:hypothetical protein